MNQQIDSLRVCPRKRETHCCAGNRRRPGVARISGGASGWLLLDYCRDDATTSERGAGFAGKLRLGNGRHNFRPLIFRNEADGDRLLRRTRVSPKGNFHNWTT